MIFVEFSLTKLTSALLNINFIYINLPSIIKVFKNVFIIYKRKYI